MTSGKKRAELKRLSKDARKTLHSMLRLADELLRDLDYVDQFGGESNLLDDLEAKEFAHFGGSPTLTQMLRAFRANPSQATWEEYSHNVWAMIELARPAKDAGPAERVNWKSLAKELQVQVETLTVELEKQRQENEKLSAEVRGLAEQNAEMRGELKTFRSLQHA